MKTKLILFSQCYDDIETMRNVFNEPTKNYYNSLHNNFFLNFAFCSICVFMNKL